MMNVFSSVHVEIPHRHGEHDIADLIIGLFDGVLESEAFKSFGFESHDDW